MGKLREILQKLIQHYRHNSYADDPRFNEFEKQIREHFIGLLPEKRILGGQYSKSAGWNDYRDEIKKRIEGT